MTDETCVWTEDNDGVWDGSCGIAWTFESGGPTENRVNFCPRCGRVVVVQEPDQE